MRFNHWAMPVTHRGWATAAVVLHRLQRITVHTPWLGHRLIRRGEVSAFSKATAL